MPKKLHHFHPLLVWQIHVSNGIRCCPTFPIKTLLVFISCSQYIPSKTIYSQPNFAVSLLQIYEFPDNSTSVYDILYSINCQKLPQMRKAQIGDAMGSFLTFSQHIILSNWITNQIIKNSVIIPAHNYFHVN